MQTQPKALDRQDAGSSAPATLQAPPISLPKGGGAIRGMGEKFAANPVTGTGAMTVPIAASPGRSGFGPQLNLTYDSGSGNGPFGFGWSLSLPSITRKTDKGLPQYHDGEDADVFILTSAEDLVPVLDTSGNKFEDSSSFPDYKIHRYRPRIEGLFARIERWTYLQTGESHWRSITRDNVTTLYGKDNNSRIFDPADPDPAHPTRIFNWLICESYDDKGNHLLYDYKAEDSLGVDPAQAHEKNRTDSGRSANRYLKRIQYGNKVSRLAASYPAHSGWMFEVVFDYGEGHYASLSTSQFVRASASAGQPWAVRPDPFSTYRAGFELRTYRRCQRVLMFHHFAELGVDSCLVRSTEFEYADLNYSQPTTINDELAHQGSTRFASFIQSVTQSGYVRQPLSGQPNRYLKKSLPPLAFEYSKAVIQEDIHELDAASLENLPTGLDGSTYQWVDLDGEGLSGILSEQAEAWFYKRNLGDGHFGPLERVATKPSLAALTSGRQQLLDLAGDGQIDLVSFSGPTPGFYERTQDEGWENHKAFGQLPNIAWDDPNLRFVDLDGDGHADVLVTEGDVFTWYPSLAEQGFASAERVALPRDEETGPRLVFADGTQSIYLADMSADGLTDLVRIRNGEVCYWPNLGYGHFGARVVMDNAPWFDHPDQFNQQHIRLADIDGSGTTDIIYLGREGVRLYFNQSGNRWSMPRSLEQFPPVDHLSSVMTADLLGNGTACLAWSTSLPNDARRPFRYIDLMGGQKPHLMIKSINNLGAETHVQYAASTKFYLKDKRDGKPWITRLAFPVHVVERVETYDYISRNRFATRYAYHHGYFDGVEREFRGFGMVEQWDTEAFAALSASDNFPAGDNVDAASHVPPVHTRTWFHTGAFFDRDHISNFFAGLIDENDLGEYYRKPGLNDIQARALLLADTVLPVGLSGEEEREACRALKGAMLRQEVYAQDDTDKAQYPYIVTEQNFTIECLQPQSGNRHAVFFTHPREAISYHYERNPDDPRVTHALTLEVDDFGNVLRSLVIGYPRADVPARQPEQNETHLTLTLNRFANYDDQADWRRVGLPVETRTYEVVKPPTATQSFTYKELSDLVTALVPLDQDEALLANTIPYEQYDWRELWDSPTEPGGLIDGVPVNTRLRLIEHVRTLYRKNDLTGLLPLGSAQSLALPGESFKLAFTPALVRQIFVDSGKLTAAALNSLLVDEGKYVHSAVDLNWWIPSGKQFFDPNANVTDPASTAVGELAEARSHFFLPRKFTDPFNHSATVEYDDNDLVIAKTQDAVGNTVTAQHDYRVLQPRLVSDPNGNRSEAAFDSLGMLVGTAVMGKPLPAPVEGDTLKDFEADLTQAQINGFYNVLDPHVPAIDLDLLKGATTRIIYDLDRFQKTQQAHLTDPAQWRPVYAATLARETHAIDPLPAQGLKIQISFSYSDGFGREIQKKIQAEPGEVEIEDAAGNITVVDITPNIRWVGSGWTIFNNKGKPVRQYEPFFSTHHQFQFGKKVGVSPILFYDPVERVVARLHPNHTYEKVVFDPWQQITWDVNDTVKLDPKTDSDVSGFFTRLPDTEYLPTWYNQHLPSADAAERAAAQKTEVHANTPAIAHFDSLGRTFLTVADNGPAGKYETRVELDIENNQRSVTDALGRIVMTFDYDMLSAKIHQASMEAGARWMLSDVTGKPIRAWDSRGFLRRMTYDDLRRPTGLYVTENGAERLAERTVYGESQGDAANHRTRAYQVFDGAGIVTSVAYDFKGNLLEGRRDLLPTYKQAVDWLLNQAVNDGSFTSLTTFDALNRPLTATSPDGSVYRPTFNEANLLDKVDVNLRGAATATSFVTNIDYDAKGQRTLIYYSNGAETTYEYDEQTFRLTRLLTARPTGLNGLAAQLFVSPATVQDLHYAYDPAGNITSIVDSAVAEITYNSQQVKPQANYLYDPIYRLLVADGREHIGQTAFDFNPPTDNYRDYPFEGLQTNPNIPQAVRNYAESYDYDEVGNIKQVRHSAVNGSWTRDYRYEAWSLIEPGSRKNNRLTSTKVGNSVNFTETYGYADGHGNDVHGCMTSINAMQMGWDFKDQLQTVALVGGGTAYYVYDALGQRVRKVIERQNGTKQKERIYLGGFELYRQYNGAGGAVDLKRETLHIMDDKQRIALVETRTDTVVPEQLIRFQFGNHLGSASLELDADGSLISYEEYHPYGTTAFQSGRSAAEVSLKRYRYIGKERDEESGLYYQGARYYAPWLGRWVSCDPVGLVGGQVLYSYTQDNPVRFVDVTGHGPKPPSPLEFTGDERVRQVNLREASRRAPESADKTSKQGAEAAVRGIAFGVTDIVEGMVRGMAGLDENNNFSLGTFLRTNSLVGAAEGLVSMFKSTGEDVGSGSSMLVSGDDDEEAARRLTRGILNTVQLVEMGSKAGSALVKEPGPKSASASVKASGEQGFRNIEGQEMRLANPDKAAMYKASLKAGVEVGETVDSGGKIRTKAGTATDVALKADASIVKTTHTHPTSGVALLSEGDVTNLKGKFQPDASHSVLGEKWPETRKETIRQGIEPPKLVVLETTVKQWMIDQFLIQ